uniref:Uncharacterized protein n=1 Tax=Oryza glumipatula TaxID=40148 RepID=A0A0E0BHX4_9ORYZ
MATCALGGLQLGSSIAIVQLRPFDLVKASKITPLQKSKGYMHVCIPKWLASFARDLELSGAYGRERRRCRCSDKQRSGRQAVAAATLEGEIGKKRKS